MRFNLKVSFAEKDQVKKLGARWDPARKLWYVDGKDDMTPFAKWSPTPHDDASEEAAPLKSASAPPQQTTGKAHVGSRYVEHPRVCDCPPWELCDQCRPTAL